MVTAIGNDAVTVRLVGEIDQSLTPPLAALADLLARLGRPVVIDTTGVQFGDSALTGFIDHVAQRNRVTVSVSSRLVGDLLHVFHVSVGGDDGA